MKVAQIVGFTLIETLVLVAWLILAGVPFTGHVTAVAVLYAGLLLEHITAYNTGAGRPFFSLPD